MVHFGAQGVLLHSQNQDCGVGVETAVGVSRSSAVLPAVRIETRDGKKLTDSDPSQTSQYHPSTDDDLGRAIMYRPSNIENGKKKRLAVWRES